MNNVIAPIAHFLVGAGLACSISAPLHAGTPSASAASFARHAAEPAARVEKSSQAAFAFPVKPSNFVTLRPSTTEDVFDPKDVTAPGTGRLSLREAFMVANQLNVEVAIVLERGAIYRLERCGPLGDSSGEHNELTHTANKTLTVNGNAATIFQDCDGSGVLVQRGGTELLNLVDFTLQGGRSRHSPAGGVWNSGVGEVRITNMVVRDNQANVDAGSRLVAGGVSSNGMVIISGATFTQNRASSGAGAVAAAGAIKAIKSSFFQNSGSLAGAILGGGSAPHAQHAPEAGPPSGPPPGPPAAFTGLTPNGVTLIYSTLSDNGRPVVVLRGGELTAFASFIGGPGSGMLCDLAGARAHSLGHNVTGDGDCGLAEAGVNRPASSSTTLMSVTGMKGVDVLAASAASELLDAIPPSECFPPFLRAYLPVYSGATTDELGVRRPQGKGCDIGAIESLQSGSLRRDIAAVPVSMLSHPTHLIPREFGADPQHILVVDTEDDVINTRQLSLREAFAQANRGNAEIIRLTPGKTYRLERCAAPQSAADNDTNDLMYTARHPLTVEGNGASIVQTCDGSGVIALYSDSTVTLQGLTVTGGRSVIHPGGGIYMAGSGELQLDRAWVTDNATVAAGGGIASFGNVTLLDSTVSNNHSSEVGGGIIATADVTAINSSIFDNTADLAIGAIGNHSGKLRLIFTTIARNSAPNVAVGSIDSIGSIVADYLAPRPPPGNSTEAPQPAGPPGGFPPPANCDVQHPGILLDGNFATDGSCGFSTVGVDAGLVSDPVRFPHYLRPSAQSAVLHLVPAARCAEYRDMLDQAAEKRSSSNGCASGAIGQASDNSHTRRPSP